MKLIIQGGRVVATATADYQGESIDAPADFDGARMSAYRYAGGVLVLPVLSQFERDQARYAKRAAAKDGLLAYMAADNMSLVRSGEWTVAQLTSLMADPALAAANAYMSTLSFELAAQAIAQAQTPLLTPGIRADWIARLQAHCYLEG